jgi:uncharacterized protein (DUF362 family)
VRDNSSRIAVLKTSSDLYKDVEKLIHLINIEEVISPGDKILLKPNLHAVQSYKTGGITNPYVVESIIKFAYEQGAKEVIVGDSPFYGCSEPERCFTDTGMAEIVEKAGAKWVTFQRHNFKIFKNKSKILPEIGISEFVFNCDKMINIAAMKTHSDCLVTLGMKNLKGCIRDKDKINSHRNDLDRVIVDLNKLVEPDLTIIDGTIGMEGMGPAAGTPVNAGLLIAGKDIVSIDSVASFLMGIDPKEVLTIRLGYEAGLGEMNLNKIKIVKEESILNINDLRKSWKRPDFIFAQKFPWLKLKNKSACSGCKINFFKALDNLNGSDKELESKIIVMGKDLPDDKQNVLIGNCTSNFWKEHSHLPGCPPKVISIKEFISKQGRIK